MLRVPRVFDFLFPNDILIADSLLNRVSLETKTYVTTTTFAGNILLGIWCHYFCSGNLWALCATSTTFSATLATASLDCSSCALSSSRSSSLSLFSSKTKGSKRLVKTNKLKIVVTFIDIFHQEEFGVPCQYGLYFAMGLALSMEGVMSSSYHICPTNVTFQFDTTFMYLIAVLMFMKLYQVVMCQLRLKSYNLILYIGSTCGRLSKCCWCVFWARGCTSSGNHQHLLQWALVLGRLLHRENPLNLYEELKEFYLTFLFSGVHHCDSGRLSSRLQHWSRQI